MRRSGGGSHRDRSFKSADDPARVATDAIARIPER